MLNAPIGLHGLTGEEREPFPLRFFAVAFGWSWLIWLPLVLAGTGIVPFRKDLLGALTVPWIALGVFGPGVGALYSLRTLRGPGAVREYLRGVLDLRFGSRAWVVPPLVLGATTWLAWILPELWGAPRLPMLLPTVWMFAPYLLLMVFFGGGQEELGWRGYILDPLEERLGPWLANLVLGVVWAVWHLPLFFIPGASQRFVPFLAFTLLLIGYSYLYAAVREMAGKRTMVGLVAHGWGNAFVPLFPTLVMAEGSPQVRYWIWAALTLLAGIFSQVVRSKRKAPLATPRS